MVSIVSSLAVAETSANASFGVLDWLVVLIYFAAVLGIGYWSSRSQKTKRDYFLGGRNLPWWVVGLSILATETSALTFIGVPAYAFGFLEISETGKFSATGGNMLFIQLIIGYVVGRFLIAWKIVPLYFTGDVYTPFQLLKRAFGKQPRYVAALLSLVGMALGAGVRVLVTAIPVTIVMRTALPEWTLDLSIIVIMLAALIYTSMGGIKAVVWTDMIQYFIFIGGGLFTVLYIPSLLHGDLSAPSGATSWGAISEVASDNLQWFHSGFLGTQAVVERYGESYSSFEWVKAQLGNIIGGPFNIIMGIVPQTIGILLAFGFDQLNVQRVLGCRNVSEGRKAVILSAILIFPQFLLFLLIGVCLYAFYHLNGFDFGLMPWDPKTVDEATGYGTPKGDFVFPVFMVTRVPIILKGFLVAGILAAAMSSVSSALSAMSSISIMDLYRPVSGGKQTEKAELRIAIIATVGAGIALGVIAYFCKAAELIMNLAFQLAGLTGGAILGAFLFGMWRKRGYAVPVITGMVTSFLFMIVYNLLRANKVIAVNWPWDVTIGMLVCFLTAATVTLSTGEPTDRDIGSSEYDDV